MTIRVGDKVSLRRDIFRKEGLYALEGETGYVLEIFSSWSGKHKPRTLHAKVKMNDCLKTFRLTSLEKIS